MQQRIVQSSHRSANKQKKDGSTTESGLAACFCGLLQQTSKGRALPTHKLCGARKHGAKLLVQNARSRFACRTRRRARTRAAARRNAQMEAKNRRRTLSLLLEARNRRLGELHHAGGIGDDLAGGACVCGSVRATSQTRDRLVAFGVRARTFAHSDFLDLGSPNAALCVSLQKVGRWARNAIPTTTTYYEQFAVALSRGAQRVE